MYKDVLEGWELINNILLPQDTIKMTEAQKKQYDLIINTVPLNIHIDRLGLKARRILKGENSRITDEPEIEANIKLLKQIGWDGENIPHTYIPVKKVEGFEKGKYIGICAGYDDSENFRWRFCEYLR